MTTFLYSPVIVVDPGVPPATRDALAEVLHGGHLWAATHVAGEVDVVAAGPGQLPGQHTLRHRTAAQLQACSTLRAVLSGPQVE